VDYRREPEVTVEPAAPGVNREGSG
jgi:hypothetical protein